MALSAMVFDSPEEDHQEKSCSFVITFMEDGCPKTGEGEYGKDRQPSGWMAPTACDNGHPAWLH